MPCSRKRKRDSDRPHDYGDEWPTPKRARVKLMKDLGYARQEIQDQTDVSIYSQIKIINGPERRPGRYRKSKPQILTKDDFDSLIYLLEGRYSRRIMK